MARSEKVTIRVWISEMQRDAIDEHSVWMNENYIVRSEGQDPAIGEWTFYLMGRHLQEPGALYHEIAELEDRTELGQSVVPAVGDAYW